MRGHRASVGARIYLHNLHQTGLFIHRPCGRCPWNITEGRIPLWREDADVIEGNFWGNLRAKLARNPTLLLPFALGKFGNIYFFWVKKKGTSVCFLLHTAEKKKTRANKITVERKIKEPWERLFSWNWTIPRLWNMRCCSQQWSNLMPPTFPFYTWPSHPWASKPPLAAVLHCLSSPSYFTCNLSFNIRQMDSIASCTMNMHSRRFQPPSSKTLCFLTLLRCSTGWPWPPSRPTHSPSVHLFFCSCCYSLIIKILIIKDAVLHSSSSTLSALYIHQLPVQDQQRFHWLKRPHAHTQTAHPSPLWRCYSLCLFIRLLVLFVFLSSFCSCHFFFFTN